MGDEARRVAGARLVAAGALALVAGCKATPQAQLEEVAKDWNRVVRASQVIPIYPLTQDLQPGDVFLVQTPIEEQQELWKGADYLPLDYHLTRVQPDGYAGFYKESFFDVTAQPSVPRDWLAQKSAAPSAAFPSYSFSVSRGGGLNLAVPVSGVPVGLSLLGAEAAQGTMTLGSARTFGVDIASLEAQVGSWALDHRDLLRGYAPPAGERPGTFLRVVTRVYIVGSIDLSLRSADQQSAGLDGGVPKPVELLTLDPSADTSKSSTEQYTKGIAALNAMLESARATGADAATSLLPGGSLRVTAASARSISMQETFDPPLVVGYLGFDLPVLRGGFVGRAMPTFAVLSGVVAVDSPGRIAGDEVGEVYAGALALDVYQVLGSREDDPRAQAIVARLDALAGLSALQDALGSSSFYQLRSDGRLLATPMVLQAEAGGSFDYRSFRAFTGKLQMSVNSLRDALADLPVTLVRPDQPEVEVAAGSVGSTALAQALQATQALQAELVAAEHRRVAAAIAYLDLLANPGPDTEPVR